MKFKIDEKSVLTIIDDKKEIVVNTDKFELIELMKKIQDHLLGCETGKTEKVATYTYKYNPRSQRHEKVLDE